MDNSHRDRGNVLPIVLVVSVVLAIVVVGLASYAAGTLRYGQQVELASDRLAAADGGIDYLLDTLRQRRTLCTSALAETPGGVTETMGGTINGLSPTVNCRVLGTGTSTLDEWAVIMTGAAGATAPLLRVSGGGGSDNADKTFTGRVFMERLEWNLLADLTIDEGDLWHSTSTCPDVSHKWGPTDAAAPTVPSELSFTPASRGLMCTTATWTELFEPKRPVVPTLPTELPTPPNPTIDPTGCAIWRPGRYTAPPNFENQSYNYFASGNYFFDNVGEIETKNSYVLAGYPGPAGPSIIKITPQDTIDNHPCRFAWRNDPGGDALGATFYLGGNSSIFVGGGSALEISGRRQGNIRVSIQALDAGPSASTLTGNSEIVTTKSGSGSQLAMKGLVWTPRATFAFSQIANETVAALRGGAVVARLVAGAAANTNNFLIEVVTQPSATAIALTSTATNSGSTSVRAVVEYRPSDGAYALRSRRVLSITPE